MEGPPTILHSAPNLFPVDQRDHERESVAGDRSEGAGGDTAKEVSAAAHPTRRFTMYHRLLKPHEYEQVFNATGQPRRVASVPSGTARASPGVGRVPPPPGGGYQSSSGGVTLRARRNGGDVPRLGLIISKKSIKRAVDRNRVKRMTRESFRLCQSRLSGLDVVIMSRAGLGELSGPALRAVLDKHWDALARWMERWKKS